jgi:hypothetical protein
MSPTSAEAPAPARANADQDVPRPLARMERALGPIILAGFALLYLLTTATRPGYHGDSAKLQVVGEVLGTAHPPGYPLYSALLGVVTRIAPFGTVAWRANLLSVLAAVGALVLLHRAARTLGLSRVASATVVVVLGAGFTFWSQAIVTEVYALEALFLGGVLLLLARFLAGGDGRWFAASMGLLAFATGSHRPSLVLLALPLVVAVWPQRDRAPVGATVAAGLGGGLLGLATYGYIVWRSLDPTTVFLEARIVDLGTFIETVTAARFAEYFAGFGLGDTWGRVRLMTAHAVRDLGFLALALAAAGAGAALADRRLRFVPVWVAATSLFTLQYAVIDINVFYLPAFVGAALAAGVGVDLIGARLPAPTRAALLGVPILLAGLLLSAAAPRIEHYVRQVDGTWAGPAVAAVPEGALLLVGDYHAAMFALYAAEVEQSERDVEVRTVASAALPDVAEGATVAEHRPVCVMERYFDGPPRPPFTEVHRAIGVPMPSLDVLGPRLVATLRTSCA